MFYQVTRDDLSLSGVLTWFIRLEKGEEILESLTGFCKKMNSNMGSTGIITGIGALSLAELGWFDPVLKKYTTKTIQQNMEITSLIGNLSLKEKEPFFHIHVTLSNHQFEVMGGHLLKAIISVTGEIILRTFKHSNALMNPTVKLIRELDQESGLFLWGSMEKFDEIG